VVLAANPGWKPVLNVKENEFCLQAPEDYVDMMFNFFHRHSIVRDGVYSRWWTRAMVIVYRLKSCVHYDFLEENALR